MILLQYTVSFSNYNTSHKLSTKSITPLSMLCASAWDNFVAQPSVYILFQHAKACIKEMDMTYMCRVDHSRPFTISWLGFNNLYVIMSQISHIYVQSESFENCR